ncbi:alpha/beta fold hydrolase [Salinibacterium sp. ZJ70]|uniref:alpha/beta fold hydrolase n=1 Tax=Salinibacterium sp. ZJ70 TaxID=2708084 RepID=UPI001422CF94|nr:alpha/beta hydrolase [Salinibacterium sp. ZJ70]
MGWNPFKRAPLLHVAGDVGSGPVVIMIHGIASSSVTFHNVVPLLETRYRCITIDLLGFGESPAPLDCAYKLEDHVAALDRTIRSLRLRGPFVLVGHSMGALIGTRYAARNRRRVKRLVLVNPPIYINPRALSGEYERTLQDLYLRVYRFMRENPQLTQRQAGILSKLTPIPNVLEVTAENWVPFVRSLENTIESQTTISDLAFLDAPVEIVYGTLDQFASPGGIRIAERLRGVNVTRVRASDHLVGKRLARAVAAAVDDDE